MPKYLIKYVYERWYDLEIEASSKDEALDKFHSADFEEEKARLVGGELQDSVVVEEVVNANN
jgi:hypothetical protein